MEFRKVVGFGHGSYVVSIPKAWVKKNNLEKGDTLSIEENNEDLILSRKLDEKKRVQTTITIDSRPKEEEMLRSEIISAYLNTYDTIEIIKDPKASSQQIKDIVRNLAGMEIIEQSSKRIVAKDLINIREVSLPGTIKRMDMTIRGMIEDAITCIDDSSAHESINDCDIDVNRLYYLICRVVKAAVKNPQIMKAYSMDFWELHSSLYIATRLEKIADRQKRIARNLAKSSLSKNASYELKNIYNDANEVYLEVMKAYYKKEMDKAHKINVGIRPKIEACNKFLEQHSHYCGLKQKTEVRERKCASTSKIVENLKATLTSVKYIARNVLDSA